MEVVLEIFFFFFNSADFQFSIKKLTWKFYTTAEALSTIKRVELIDKYKFAKVMLNEYSDTFVIYVTVLETLVAIYSDQTTLVDILQ